MIPIIEATVTSYRLLSADIHCEKDVLPFNFADGW